MNVRKHEIIPSVYIDTSPGTLRTVQSIKDVELYWNCTQA